MAMGLESSMRRCAARASSPSDCDGCRPLVLLSLPSHFTLYSRFPVHNFFTNPSLTQIPLGRYFPEYAGGNDLQKAAKYILWKFMQENRAKLTVYPQ